MKFKTSHAIAFIIGLGSIAIITGGALSSWKPKTEVHIACENRMEKEMIRFRDTLPENHLFKYSTSNNHSPSHTRGKDKDKGLIFSEIKLNCDYNFFSNKDGIPHNANYRAKSLIKSMNISKDKNIDFDKVIIDSVAELNNIDSKWLNEKLFDYVAFHEAGHAKKLWGDSEQVLKHDKFKNNRILNEYLAEYYAINTLSYRIAHESSGAEEFTVRMKALMDLSVLFRMRSDSPIYKGASDFIYNYASNLDKGLISYESSLSLSPVIIEERLSKVARAWQVEYNDENSNVSTYGYFEDAFVRRVSNGHSELLKYGNERLRPLDHIVEKNMESAVENKKGILNRVLSFRDKLSVSNNNNELEL